MEVAAGGVGQVGVFKVLRKAAVLVSGGGLLCVGFVFLFLPAPGVATMMAGLGVLSTEFAWAKRWLTHGKRLATSAHANVRGRFRRPARAAV